MSTVRELYQDIVSLVNTYGYQLFVDKRWDQTYLVRVKTTVPYDASFDTRFFDEDGYATWEYESTLGAALIDEMTIAYNYMVDDFIDINA